MQDVPLRRIFLVSLLSILFVPVLLVLVFLVSKIASIDTVSKNSISSQQLARLDSRTTITDVVERFGDGKDVFPRDKAKRDLYRSGGDCRSYPYPYPEKNYQEMPDQKLKDTYTYTLCFNPDSLRLEYVEKRDGTAIPKPIPVPVG